LKSFKLKKIHKKSPLSRLLFFENVTGNKIHIFQAYAQHISIPDNDEMLVFEPSCFPDDAVIDAIILYRLRFVNDRKWPTGFGGLYEKFANGSSPFDTLP